MSSVLTFHGVFSCTLLTSNNMISLVIWCKIAKLHMPYGLMQFYCLWNIYSCLFTPNFTQNHAITYTYIFFWLVLGFIFSFLVTIVSQNGWQRQWRTNVHWGGAIWRVFWVYRTATHGEKDFKIKIETKRIWKGGSIMSGYVYLKWLSLLVWLEAVWQW